MTAATYPRLAFTAPERAELVIASRAPLGPEQVAGPTQVTLISPGTELAWGYTAPEGFPVYPGYAAVFRVEEVGAEVTDLAAGDLALCMGNHAGWQQARRRDAVPLPAGLAPEAAACARLMGVSMSTLTTTAARPPEPVAISGLGPVGHFAAQIFQAAGYEVLAVDPLPARRADARAAGIRQVAEALPEEGNFTLVAECSGHEQAVLDACRCVRPGGEVVLIGVPWARQTDLMAFDLLHAVFHRYVHLRSGWEWEVPLHPEPFRRNSIFGQLAGALRWLAEGRLNLEGLYAPHAPAAAQEVYQALLHRRNERLLAMFDWR
ncbi:MAG TPA: zinc-binding dehydrogenase [Armatimonadota bacterium]|jgi:threonine dehydrogenase-like Zn-dependent dehydrogenase